MNEKGNMLKTEMLLSQMLRSGVLFCATLISAGVAWGWLSPGNHQGITPASISSLMNGQLFSAAESPNSIAALEQGLFSLNSNSIISLGLLALILLPILRVAMTMILFLQKKDYIYVGITAVVLLVLLGSIFLGKGL
jgi:uncharacterized membrane protein